jgi:hypothetical protein
MLLEKIEQNIKQVPEGYLLTEINVNPNTKLITGLAIKFAQSLFLLTFFSPLIVMIGRSQILDLFVVRLFVVIIVAMLMAWIYNTAKTIYGIVDRLLVSLSFDPAELIFTNYPLSLGEDVSVLFRRKLRSGKIIREAGTVNASLFCIEDVVGESDDDSNRSFLTEKVINQKLPEVLVPAYESAIEVIFNIKIPANAPATFEANHNQIKWMLEVSLDFPKLLKEGSKFYLNVEPYLMNQIGQINPH